MTEAHAVHPEYQECNVGWLGRIPGTWRVCRVKDFAQLLSGYPFDSKQFDPVEGVPLIRIRDIASSQTEVRVKGHVPRESLVRDGDVLVGMDGDFNVAWWNAGEAALNQRVACLRADTPALQRFLFYLLPFSMQIANDLTYFTTVKHLSNADILKTRFAMPSTRELSSIGAFLDYETAKIDALIEKQQQLIALLKEKRQAVISHAVTKGLNSNAPMRDSGVEWLGEVPAHWIAKRLKHISPKVGVGLVINPSTYTRDEGVYFIFGGDVKKHRFDLTNTRRISPEDSDRLIPSRLNARDLLSVRVGDPGITAVVPPELEGANCASVIIVRRGDFDSNWLCSAMNSWVGRQQVGLVAYGAAQKQFNVSDAVEFVFPVPPREEQESIANFISDKLQRFETLSRRATDAVELLQERRTALISAAVTGKIDVRNWRPPSN